MTGAKLAEFNDSHHPAIRLVTEAYDDNPRRFLRVQERDDSQWTTIGRAELHPDLGVDLEGDLQGRVVVDWPGPYSIRRTTRHRLVVDRDTGDDATLVLEHQKARVDDYKADIGPDDWDPQERWTLTPDSVTASGGATA